MSDNRVEEIVEEMDIDEDPAFRHVGSSQKIYARPEINLVQGNQIFI
jgi:hypothetical protein